jgi:predicted nucleic acid-binding protein
VIVLDSSAAIEYVALRGHGDWVESQIRDDSDVHAPHLLDVEVASGLRGLVLRGDLAPATARVALDDFVDLDIARYPHVDFLERIWDLRKHISAYDAAYVSLAEVLDATLVTTDRRLGRSHGHRARIVSP